MRKFLAFLSCVLISFTTFECLAGRVTICDAREDMVVKCGKGCYYAVTGIGSGSITGPGGVENCTFCPVGTYSDIDDAMQTGFETGCKECTSPAGAQWVERDSTGSLTGFVDDTCPWTLSCSAGTYFDSKNSKCAACGTHYQAKNPEGECVVRGNGKGDVSDGEGAYENTCSFNDICTGLVYKVELNKNTNIESINTGNNVFTYSDSVVYAKYGAGFATSPTGPSWGKVTPENGGLMSIAVKKLNGYSTDRRCTSPINLANYLNNWGVLGLPDQPAGNDQTDLVLYACWNNAKIILRHYLNADNFKDATCSFSDDDTEVKCVVSSEFTPYAAGGEFEGYKCSYISGSMELSCILTDSDKLFLPGDVLPLPASTIILRPQFSSCKPGYYCDANGVNKCPVGTTSDEGAESIAECYLNTGKGANSTRFCDSNGCFYLPDTGIITYNPS